MKRVKHLGNQNYKITTPALSAPISVEDLNTHLQLFGDNSYDAELAQLIYTAQEHVSNQLGKIISDTGIELPLKGFSDITLPHSEVTSLSVTYYDENNATQVMALGVDYILDPTGFAPRVHFERTPLVSNQYDYPAFISYTASFSSVPAVVKHAILMTAAELFEVRTESTDAKDRVAQICVSRLLSKHRKVVI
jgi:uncharacterized phiE125 gp8 family phage protein